MSDTPRKFTVDDARRIGERIGIDWTTSYTETPQRGSKNSLRGRVGRSP